jgi:uncharacterized protein (DUF302 family)
MKKGLLILMTSLWIASGAAMAEQGLINKAATGSVQETADRLEAMLDANPAVRVIARVDHSANARSVEKQLTPTVLLIFGNPVLGTELMKENQAVGIDLPMKILVWEDDAGKTWVTYNDPTWIASRHGLTKNDAVITKMSGALNKISDKATGNP